MSNYCVQCGSPLPDDQGSSTCSMCYGDIGHGKDGYYEEWAQAQIRQAIDQAREQEDRK